MQPVPLLANGGNEVSLPPQLETAWKAGMSFPDCSAPASSFCVFLTEGNWSSSGERKFWWRVHRGGEEMSRRLLPMMNNPQSLLVDGVRCFHPAVPLLGIVSPKHLLHSSLLVRSASGSDWPRVK